jgi:hypothetical protein
MYRNPLCFQNQRAKWTEGDPLNGLLDKRTILKFEKIYDVTSYLSYVDTEVASRSLTAFKEENKPEQRSVNNKELNAFDAQIIINSNL